MVLEVADGRDMCRPLIEKANEVAPAFAKIFKEMIIVADLDKPLPRSAKGNVSRKLALQIYAEEIDKLYVPFTLEMFCALTMHAQVRNRCGEYERERH